MPAKSTQSGFTLMELVIGIVVFAIVLTIVTAVIAPQASRSVDPIMQVRATELAQSLFNEIMGKAFDENSDRAGGLLRCDIDGTDCTAIADLGPDSGESRDRYDDVDDYHGLNTLGNSLGHDLSDDYSGFSVSVSVAYDGDMDGLVNEVDVSDALLSSEKPSKQIQITVTTPTGDSMVFSAYRSNF